MLINVYVDSFILGDDMDFYEEYTIHLTDEEQENRYIKCNVPQMW